MSHAASRRFVLGCTLAVLIVVLILHFVFCRLPDSVSHGAGDGTGDAGLADSPGPFAIAGNATEPISPGVRAPRDLRLTNPHGVPMSSTDLRVRVQKVSAPNANDARPCTVGDFMVNQTSDLEVTVAALSTSTLSNLGLPRAKQPHVGMINRPANQDGCKGASLTLAYTATGALEQ